MEFQLINDNMGKHLLNLAVILYKIQYGNKRYYFLQIKCSSMLLENPQIQVFLRFISE